MKKIIWFTFLAAIGLVMLWTALLKMHSYVIDIYSRFDVKPECVQDMQREFRDYQAALNDNDHIMSFEDFKQWEREKIKHEIKILNALEVFVQALNTGNQFGR